MTHTVSTSVLICKPKRSQEVVLSVVVLTFTKYTPVVILSETPYHTTVRVMDKMRMYSVRDSPIRDVVGESTSETPVLGDIPRSHPVTHA